MLSLPSLLVRFLQHSSDSFTYTISDGKGGVITQTASIAVQGVKDAPEIFIKREGVAHTSFYVDSYNFKAPILKVRQDGSILAAAQGKLEQFSTDGLLTDMVSTYTSAVDIATTYDNKILLLSSSRSSGYITLARYNSDGNLDTTFNETGSMRIESSQGPIQAFKITTNTNGKIILTGALEFKPDKFTTLTAVINEDGTLDSNFNPNGQGTSLPGLAIVNPMYSANLSYGYKGFSSIVNEDDSIVVAASEAYGGGLRLFHYSQTGELISEYNIEDKGINSSKLIIDNNGKLLVAGLKSDSFGEKVDIWLGRFNDDLSVDTSFSGGQVVTSINANYQSVRFHDVVITEDGGILLTASRPTLAEGDTGAIENSEFLLIKYNNNGSLDTNFHDTGILVTEASGLDFLYGMNTEISGDGYLTASGYIYNSDKGVYQAVIISYDANGKLITNFGMPLNLEVLQNTDYIFQVNDFGFKDIDGDLFEAVLIDGTPTQGKLLLDGQSVNVGDKILVEDIESGLLIFRPEPIIIENNYASITYRVQDDGGVANGGQNISEQVSLKIDVVSAFSPIISLQEPLNYYSLDNHSELDITNINTLSDNAIQLNDIAYLDQSSDFHKFQKEDLPLMSELLDIGNSVTESEKTIHINPSNWESNHLSLSGITTVDSSIELTTLQVQDFNSLLKPDLFETIL